MSTTFWGRKPLTISSLFNGIVVVLAKCGVSLAGTRVLSVRGRKTGETRELPVNVLHYAGERYLVAPRGQTQWVRNLRVNPKASLCLGRCVELLRAVELADDDKPPLLRAYLKKWKWEVGVFFEGIDADSSDAKLRRVATGYPVFHLRSTDR